VPTTVHADDESFEIATDDIGSVFLGPEVTFAIPSGTYTTFEFVWSGTWADTDEIVGVPVALKLTQVGELTGVASSELIDGDGAFSPIFTPNGSSSSASVLAMINNAAGGDLSIQTLIDFFSATYFDNAATFTTTALTLQLDGTPEWSFEVSPGAHTADAGHFTEQYRIDLSNPAGSGGQDFLLAAGMGGGTFFPAATVTVLEGNTWVTFQYKNTTAGTYVLGVTPSGGDLDGDDMQTVEAVFRNAGNTTGDTPIMAGNTIVDGDDVYFVEAYAFGTKEDGTEDDVPFLQLQNITLKDALTLKELEGPGTLSAAAVGASGAKVTLSAKYAGINAKQFEMFRGSSINYDGGTDKTTIARGVNQKPRPFTLHCLTPTDTSGSDTDMEYIFYGCICPDLGNDNKLHDFSMQDVTVNVYGNGTDFYHLILPGNQTE